MSAARLRGKDLGRPFVGIRIDADPAAEEAKAHPVDRLAWTYAVKMSSAEFFSHSTAAVLHGMWLPLELEQADVLHVSVRKPARAPRDRRVKGHHLTDRAGLVVDRGGLRVASPLETWCQLATQLRIPDLVVAGDSLLTRIAVTPR